MHKRNFWETFFAPLTAIGISSIAFQEPKYERIVTPGEVALNDGRNGRRTYVTYRGGVHDVSDFKKVHPGGKYIEQAAGGDVEDFWKIWSYHMLSPKVKLYLDETRIGRLETSVGVSDDGYQPYSEEPTRNEKMTTVLIQQPFCSESPPDILQQHYLTPSDVLYIRNHAPVPYTSDVETHQIEFKKTVCSGDDSDCSQSISLKDLLARFESKKVISVIQCAGNRASEDIAATGPSGFTGTPFESIGSGMVGNVQWRGVWLREVLRDVYPAECSEGDEWHLLLSGGDGYRTSVPLSMALDPHNDCLLASEMNGAALLPDHGYPVRAVLPGIAGARSVKWLESVALSRSPSDDPWNSYYYRHADGSHIQFLPLQSLILAPSRSSVVKVDARTAELGVEGVAYCGGGSQAAISCVEVSVDGGDTWTSAELKLDEIEEDDAYSPHGWVRFFAKVKLPHSSGVKDDGKCVVHVCCRARDDQGNTQPRVSSKQKGYLYNGWSSVKLKQMSSSKTFNYYMVIK